MAAIRAGLPTSVAGATVNRFCSSGLQAIAIAAHEIMHEGADVAIGGGVESITQIPRGNRDENPWIKEHCPGIYMVMGDTAEVVAKRYNIGRASAGRVLALQPVADGPRRKRASWPRRSRRCTSAEAFSTRTTGKAVSEEECDISQDECNRPDTTLEGLLALKPHFDKESGKGTVTAGNSSQLSDGASVALLMSADKARALGLKPKVAFRGFVVAGCEPDEMGIGPVFAVPKLLKRHGLKVADIGLWELNEAFAVQVIYCRDKLGIDPEKLNVNGGSIAIGHPFGMTGARLVGMIANEMQRRKARYGVVTMCVGGGQGAAGLFELCS